LLFENVKSIKAKQKSKKHCSNVIGPMSPYVFVKGHGKLGNEIINHSNLHR